MLSEHTSVCMRQTLTRSIQRRRSSKRRNRIRIRLCLYHKLFGCGRLTVDVVGFRRDAIDLRLQIFDCVVGGITRPGQAESGFARLPKRALSPENLPAIHVMVKRLSLCHLSLVLFRMRTPHANETNDILEL